MKIIPEQIKKLRERRQRLIKTYQELIIGITKASEQNGIDSSTTPYHLDYNDMVMQQKIMNEINQIDETLQHSSIQTERNFDFVDVGTTFTVHFGDDLEDKQTSTLIESGAGNTDHYSFVSLDSDFGQAVQGRKAGESFTYQVKATNRKVTATVDEIDCMKEHYAHFIREVGTNRRYSQAAMKELKELKETDPQEYERRHQLSASQIELAKEELIREKNLSPSRRGFLTRAANSSFSPLPKDDSIGVGSIVTILLRDEDENVEEKTFEFINRAISTELEGEYVERVSPLGRVLFGLHQSDTFHVRQKGKPSLTGVVKDVINDKTYGYIRVL